MVEGVGRLQNDGRQQPVEEELGSKLRKHAGLHVVDEGAKANAHQHQQAKFGKEHDTNEFNNFLNFDNSLLMDIVNEQCKIPWKRKSSELYP